MKSSQKGLTLLEMLVAITLFSLMMVFITQMVKMSGRYRDKISKEATFQRTIINTLDVLSEDFKGVGLFFDWNKNLQILYPLTFSKPPQSKPINKLQSLIYNPEFHFIAEDQEIKMATFSLIEQGQQMIRIHYALEGCPNVQTGEKTQCLIRSSVKFQDEDQLVNKHILLMDVHSLQFSYYDGEAEQWFKEWTTASKRQIPERVKMQIEWGLPEKYNKSYTFFLSNSFMRNQANQLQKIMNFVYQKDYKDFLSHASSKTQQSQPNTPPPNNQNSLSNSPPEGLFIQPTTQDHQ